MTNPVEHTSKTIDVSILHEKLKTRNKTISYLHRRAKELEELITDYKNSQDKLVAENKNLKNKVAALQRELTLVQRTA